MADIVNLDGFRTGGGGRGGSPEDPMLEQRVSRLEDDLKDIRSTLKALEVSIARLDGRVSQLPTAWTMFTAIITTVVATWGAGAAIVFTLLRFAKP